MNFFKKIINLFKKDFFVYNGKYLHNENGPAVIRKNGTQEWYVNGLRHRDGDLPAVIKNRVGEFPNVVDTSKDKNILEWYKNGLRHRENGPAIIITTKGKTDEYYYFEDKKHNLKGPAVKEESSGHQEWWIIGCQITEKEFNALPRNEKGEVHSIEEIKMTLLDGMFMNEFYFYAIEGRSSTKEEVDKYVLVNTFPVSKIEKKVKL